MSVKLYQSVILRDDTRGFGVHFATLISKVVNAVCWHKRTGILVPLVCAFMSTALRISYATALPVDQFIEAERYDAAYLQSGSLRGGDIRIMSEGWLRFDDIDFLDGAYDSMHVDIYLKQGGSENMVEGGTLEIRLDSLNGTVLGSIENILIYGSNIKRYSFLLPEISGRRSVFAYAKSHLSGVTVCGLDKIKLSGLYTFVPTAPKTYYVDALNGSDANSGESLETPFKTIQKASSVMLPGSRCMIRQGIYREIIRPAYSGLPSYPIIYQAYQKENVVVSACEPVTGWTKHSGTIYKAPMDWNIGQWENQFFVDGNMVYAASCPNVDDPCSGGKCLRKAQGDPTDGTSISPLLTRTTVSFRCPTCEGKGNVDSPDYQDSWDPGPETFWTYLRTNDPWGSPCIVNKPADHFVGALEQHYLRWYADQAVVVASENTSGILQNPGAKFTMARTYKREFPFAYGGEVFFTHLMDFLDSPNEYFFDQENGVVYLYPPNGKNPSTSLIEAKKRHLVVNLDGKNHVTIKDIKFLGGSMTMNSASHCLIDNCQFKYISHFEMMYDKYMNRPLDPNSGEPIIDEDKSDGKKGIFMTGENNTLKNSLFAYSAGSGVIVDGNNQVITNNIFHTINYMVSYDAAVYVKNTRPRGTPDGIYGSNLEISHNTMRGMGRSGLFLHDLSNDYLGRPIRFVYNDCSVTGLRSGESAFIYCANSPKNIEIAYNWFYDLCQASIWFDFRSQPSRIHHNVFWHGDHIREQIETIRGPISVRLFIRSGGAQEGNVVYNNTILTTNRSALTGTFGTNFLYGTATELGLMDSANLDFRPGPGSPAIDAGVREIKLRYWTEKKAADTPALTGLPAQKHVGCCEMHPADTSLLKDWTAPYNTGIVLNNYHGAAPDLGAYEHGGERWVPGANWKETPWHYPPEGFKQSAVNQAVTGKYQPIGIRQMGGSIIVSGAWGRAYTIKLIDPLGRTVFEKTVPEGGRHIVPMKKISAGFYVLNVGSQGGWVSHRIIHR